jgi:hypothetical protein
MTMTKAEITAEQLREVLLYDPDTGVFRWWAPGPRSRRARVGQIAGGYDVGYRGDGYWKIRIDGRRYKAHRLAWLYMTDKFPEQEIDHIDRDGTNNRWFNLREATHSQNAVNARYIWKNKLGIKGVRQASPSRYQARIRVNDRSINLGCFATPEAAHAAYVAAKRKYFGEFAP